MHARVLVQLFCAAAFAAGSASAGDGNRLTYLDELNPWYPHTDFPKLTTPQWVGEKGVECVVVLAIDDMRDTAKYEAYLRPILNRLKKIDGRAPLSIMTNTVKPDDPQLQSWLDEGLSLECHTIDHPCPLLQGGDFQKAKSTYDRCVDLMASIPRNKPVAFRMPCCDSLNTVSPRFYAEIFNRTTEKGNILQIDTSVFNVFTSRDKSIPRELVLEPASRRRQPAGRSQATSAAVPGERERFLKYLPKGLKRGGVVHDNFVNWIENYPYPYVIGHTCWEFPCVAPSDWSAQHLHGVNNPKTVADWKAALDITVHKQGVFCLVFHPHGWIRPEQIVELIDHAVKKHDKKVKFLTFREAATRLKSSVSHGGLSLGAFDSRIRILDLNHDGYLDVLQGKIEGFVAKDEETALTRVWEPGKSVWLNSPAPLVAYRSFHTLGTHGLRFGVFDKSDRPCFLLNGHGRHGFWRFDGKRWVKDGNLLDGLRRKDDRELPDVPSFNEGLRFRDLDGDGITELILAEDGESATYRLDRSNNLWKGLPFSLPRNVKIAHWRAPPPGSHMSRYDAGLRFVDINEDGHDDIVFSNHERYSVHLWVDMKTGWSRTILSGTRDGAVSRSPDRDTPPTEGLPDRSRKRKKGDLRSAGRRGQETRAERSKPPGDARWSEPPAKQSRPHAPREVRHAERDDNSQMVLPPIVRKDGSNNGFFVHSRSLLWQNEDTAGLPDLVYRVSFDKLLEGADPVKNPPKQ